MVTEDLALGTGMKFVVSPKVLLKNAAPAKLLGSLLVSFVEYSRRFQVLFTASQLHGDQLSDRLKMEVGKALATVHHQIIEIAKFMKIKWPSEPLAEKSVNIIMKYGELAGALPPLLTSDETKEAWFKLAMKLIGELTEENYQDPRFGLPGRTWKKDQGGGASLADQNVKQALREGFMSVIRKGSSSDALVDPSQY